MSIASSFIGEIKHEASLTRKLLAAVPLDKKDWKPHEKSMSLGRLATHIAENPQWASRILANDTFEFGGKPANPRVAGNTDELLGILDKNVEEAVKDLEKATDADMEKIWTVKRGDMVLFNTPKKVAIRGWAFSHQFHHRGQLTVYLRLLGIAVPGMYGPSADEQMG